MLYKNIFFVESSFSGGGYIKLFWLDVSHNYIMAVDDEVLAGENTSMKVDGGPVLGGKSNISACEMKINLQ